jgi:hypothetical protein
MLMEPTCLLRIPRVPSSSSTNMVVMAVLVGLSSSSLGGMEPPPMKARYGAFLLESSRYECGVTYSYVAFASPIYVPKHKR